MTDQDLSGQKAERKQRSSGPRGHIAAIIALFALAIVAVAWFWTTRQPQQTVLPNGIIVIGVGAFVTAAVAYVRDMDASDVLEMLGELILGLFSVIGTILLGIWNWLLGLIGWN